jgi:hypothetical protein
MSYTARRIAITIAALVAAAAATTATAAPTADHSPRVQAGDHSLCC